MGKLLIFFLILSFLKLAPPVQAAQNNKFGIHITQTEDLPLAAELVNSNNGDWGYVTVVIQEKDMDKEKWQRFFDLSREKHLIPLVRLATSVQEGIWQKPTLQTLHSLAEFLNSLNWPLKNRYLIVFNEPNHDKEWGGEANPKEYAQILSQAINIFKEKSEDFFILNAGFDQAAPNSDATDEEVKFLQRMNFEIPGIFSRLDGWSSHSYPNHGFIGKPEDQGRATIKGYQWELSVLRSLGVKKNLAVFITETGWPHKLIENRKLKIENFYKPEVAATYLREAFERVWLSDERVVAVTPFILNYPFPPFAEFSWIDKDGNPYPQFGEIKNLTKIKGKVVQEEKYEIIDFSYPFFLPENFLFKGKITLKNTGQSIWGENQFLLEPETKGVKLSELLLAEGILIKPGEVQTFAYLLETKDATDQASFAWKDLPQAKIKIFKTWQLKNEKVSWLNVFLQKILLFWYNLSHEPAH